MHAVTKIVQDKVSSGVSARTMAVNVESPISAIALNKDASQVVVGGRSVFKIYGIEDEKFEELYNLRVGKHINLNFCASDIAWNHVDDNLLATGATNGSVVIWDLNKSTRSKQEHVFNEHKRTVNRVCFHEKEHNLLLSASQDYCMKLFDTRRKECTMTFTSGSTSVRDIQFSPSHLSYFAFANADEGGNIFIWDMRRPDRVEKQFTAHSGPVFAINWHPEDRNLFATAGRDKMIKIWDLSKGRCNQMIHSIASVSRIRWRPQRKFHLASCSLVVDCNICIWDIRRPFVPFAIFDSHTDVATSIAFKNKDPHVLLSGSKDGYLYQHLFKDAKRPAEDLVPAGLDVSVGGSIGHANSDKQGGIRAKQASQRRATVTNTETFVDVSSYMQVFRDQEKMSLTVTTANNSASSCSQASKKLSLTWLVESAMRYRLTGGTLEELCHHNAKVAHSLGRTQVAQSWLLLLTPYSNHLVDKLPSRSTSVTSVVNMDRADKEKAKKKLDVNTEAVTDDRNPDGTSGNSDEEPEDKEVFESRLTSIARGQVNTDWDLLFGDGELGIVDTNSGNCLLDNKQVLQAKITSAIRKTTIASKAIVAINSIMKAPINSMHDDVQLWSLPSEAFQPRHEIVDRETPIETLQNHHHGHPEPQISNVDSDAHNSKPATKHGGLIDNIILIDEQYFQLKELDCNHNVTQMLQNFAAQGDVQTSVCMLIVLRDKMRKFVDDDLQEDWFHSYIELLGRFKLWSIANTVIKLSKNPSVSMMNQQSTTIHVNCNTCNKPLQRSGWLCDRCKSITNHCCICSLPVKGLFQWCQGCSHGGHLSHMRDWFSKNHECPTGCGHLCEYT